MHARPGRLRSGPAAMLRCLVAESLVLKAEPPRTVPPRAPNGGNVLTASRHRPPLAPGLSTGSFLGNTHTLPAAPQDPGLPELPAAPAGGHTPPPGLTPLVTVNGHPPSRGTFRVSSRGPPGPLLGPSCCGAAPRGPPGDSVWGRVSQILWKGRPGPAWPTWALSLHPRSSRQPRPLRPTVRGRLAGPRLPGQAAVPSEAAPSPPVHPRGLGPWRQWEAGARGRARLQKCRPRSRHDVRLPDGQTDPSGLHGAS